MIDWAITDISSTQLRDLLMYNQLYLSPDSTLILEPRPLYPNGYSRERYRKELVNRAVIEREASANIGSTAFNQRSKLSNNHG